jgi:streptogramin lyase
VDAGGNVWITNRGANTVTELAHSGAVLATSAAALSGPAAVALDAAGDPWIANATANTLTHLSASAAVTGSASGGLSLPAGLAIDPQGNLWVSNSGAASVSEFTSSGSPLSGDGFSGSGITNPLGIAISTYCSRSSSNPSLCPD